VSFLLVMLLIKYEILVPSKRCWTRCHDKRNVT